MNDITASERRLSAALDRIDQLLETGPSRASSASQSNSALLEKLARIEAENHRMVALIATLDTQDRDDMVRDGLDELRLAEVALTEARDRLTAAGEQAARLAVANDDLAVANRALIDAASGAADADAVAAIRQALEAEIAALHAARAAEVAQMGDIVAELERLVTAGVSAGHDGRSASTMPEGLGDAAGVPEDQADNPDRGSNDDEGR